MPTLQIYMRQTQLYNYQNTPIYYSGTNPLNLQLQQGQLPLSRQWKGVPYLDWFNVTKEVGNINELDLEWAADVDNEGNVNAGAFNSTKSTSGALFFEGEALIKLKAWLFEDVSASFNKVDVKIFDTGCQKWFEGYEITSHDVQFCENTICELSVSLKQREEQLNCAKSTLIDDNWQGWFQPQPTKKHPRFGYCNEIRPNGQLVAIWILGSFNFFITNSVLLPLLVGANGLIFVINLIIGVINAIISFINALGADLNPINKIGYFDPQDVLETQRQSFVEAAGCGREHPAPLISDYIKNVCDKCGIRVDADTFPLFFNPVLKINTSSRGYIEIENPYLRSTYMNAPYQRGIRRASLPSPFRAPTENDTDYWIPENAPNFTLVSFLDHIKDVYNSEWRIRNGVLYFQRKDFYKDQNPILDLSLNGADRMKLLEGICYEWNGEKNPAVTTGIYTNDAADTCGNEALKQMNATISHVTGNVINPNMEGIQDKKLQFGGTKFRHDGASTDYLYDAAQVVLNGAAFIGLFSPMREVLQRIPRHNLLLKDESFTIPKIIIWDGVSINGAKALINKGILNNPPQPNTKYTPSLPWFARHEANTFVKGSNINPGFYPPFFYTVRNLVGGTVEQTPALLPNYPMYFEPYYQDNLWDYFHWIDDPNVNPKINMDWSAKLDMCCDLIDKLKLENDGANAVLGQSVKLSLPYQAVGVIKRISLQYKTDDDLGQHIELSGSI